jgi:hypothetical protein
MFSLIPCFINDISVQFFIKQQIPMIEDLDLIWRHQWFNATVVLHTETQKYNQILKQKKPNVCLYSALIDAYQLSELQVLSKSQDKIFFITEQNAINLPNNVEYSKLPFEFYGCFYSGQLPLDQRIEKKFNCFLNRIDPIRQTWFYLLFDRDLLDLGHVSFNMDFRPRLYSDSVTVLELFDRYHNDYLTSFDNRKEEIRSIVPFQNFTDCNDMFSLTLSSKVSIIVETYFERTDAKVLTEKTFRALQLPRPWLLFAATGCVDKIRSMGFDVYDDIVDHNYDRFDTSTDSVARQESILTQLCELVKLEFTPALIKRLQKGALHNRTLLANWNVKWQELCINQIHHNFLQALES